MISGLAEKSMAYNRSYDTDDGAIPAALRRFIRHRLFEISGVALLASLAAVGVALATWSVDDPSFNHATDQIATGIANLQQNGNSVTGNLLVSDNTKTAITGTFSGDALSLSRDTGLETIQQYQLSKKSNTYFSGTYQNIGKYPDSGTVEFTK